MGDLVGNDIADTAQILLPAGVYIIERALKDGSREGDVVGCGVIAGVDGVGRHHPQALVHPFILIGQHIVPGGLLDGDHIGEEGASLLHALDVGVVQIGLPAVGIAHLHLHGVQLLKGHGAGLLAHPILALEPLLVDGDELFDHLLHVGLGLGRKIGFGIGPGEIVAQKALDLGGGDLLRLLAALHAVVGGLELILGLHKILIQRSAGHQRKSHFGHSLQIREMFIGKVGRRGLHGPHVADPDLLRRLQSAPGIKAL